MNKEFYKQLDGLRAISVTLVLISHWVSLPFIERIGTGFIGVNVFFTLSGFLITEILLRQKDKNYRSKDILRNFYIKRSLRIFPVYYLVVFIAYIADFDYGRYLFFYNLSYTLNIYNSFTGYTGRGLSHIWSLCVEEQFYLLWPLLILIIKSKNHKALIIATIITAVGFRFILSILHVPHYSVQNYRMMPGCLDALAVGALLAYLKLRDELFLRKVLRVNAVPLVAITVYVLLVIFEEKIPVVYETFLRFAASVATFYLVGKAVFGFNNGFGRFLENRIIQYLGRISYGQYLYHLIVSTALSIPVYHFIDGFKDQLPSLIYYNSYVLTFPLYFLITIGLASLSYRFFERPFLSLKDRFEIKLSPNQKETSAIVV